MGPDLGSRPQPSSRCLVASADAHVQGHLTQPLFHGLVTRRVAVSAISDGRHGTRGLDLWPPQWLRYHVWVGTQSGWIQGWACPHYEHVGTSMDSMDS